MALPTLNTANGLSKPIAQQTEPDSQGNEGDTSITRWNHLSKPVAQQTEPDSQGNEGDTSIIHWNRLSKPIAQLMEQVSQGISYYQAVEGPLTDYESGPDDGEPVEGPLTDYEGSDDDEQRAFYGDLSDVGTSDSEEQRAFYGDMGDMNTSDNEEQRAFYGDLSDISDDAFYGDLSDAGDGEQMLLCDDLTDMSISDEDATASASIAPIVQRTKAEKKAAQKRAHLIRKRAIRKGKRKQQQEEAGTDMKRKTKKRRAEARKDAFKVNLDMSSDAPHTKSGWLGLPNEGQDGLPTKPVSKDGLVKQYGLTIIPWDGREGLVVGALAGRPWDMDWDGVHDAAYEALHSAASRLSYRQKEVTNRRGSFPTLAYGISFGGGQTEPGYLQQGSNHKEEELELHRLLDLLPPPSPFGYGYKPGAPSAFNNLATYDSSTITLFAYTSKCLKTVFKRNVSDFDRAQALYQVFIEIASELETTSHFSAVMTRIADNLESLGCKKKPCHIVNPVPSNTHNPAPSNTHYHARSFMQNPVLSRTSSSLQNLALSHTQNLAKYCTSIPAPSHIWNLACSHTTTSVRSITSPSNPSQQLKRKRFKTKKITDKLTRMHKDDVLCRSQNNSDYEMDSDGFCHDPLNRRDFAHIKRELYEEDDENFVDTMRNLMNIANDSDFLADKKPSQTGPGFIVYPSPSISIPKRMNLSSAPIEPPFTNSSSIMPHETYPLPPASTSALPLGALAPPLARPLNPVAPKVSLPLPRAQTEPLPTRQYTTTLPQRAQTAPPETSKNTLTARRCTNKEASPSSFVKFMDVPVTMTREHIHDCLQNNRKWSSVDISNVEIFAIKNKDSTVVNVLKIRFKDDAQSTIVKRVLTTSISFGDTISRRCRPWYLSTRSN
ncbi:hypothetical protein JOM56_013032 [Amanita muscaria]